MSTVIALTIQHKPNKGRPFGSVLLTIKPKDQKMNCPNQKQPANFCYASQGKYDRKVKRATTAKRIGRAALQLSICGAMSACILSLDLMPYAFLFLSGVVLTLAIGVGVTNAIYDEEMNVRKFWRLNK